PHNLPGTVSEADLQAMISGAGDFSRRRRDSSLPDLLSFFCHLLPRSLISSASFVTNLRRQGPSTDPTTETKLLLSPSGCSSQQCFLQSLTAAWLLPPLLLAWSSSMSLLSSPSPPCLLTFSSLLNLLRRVDVLNLCVPSPNLFIWRHRSYTENTCSAKFSPVAVPSWHVLNGAELHSLRLSPTPSSARCGPLWPCLLPQPGTESAKGLFFPPRLDLPDPPDCASSGFSEPPSRFIKDSEPSSDDQYLIYSLTDSMKQQTRLGSAKARVFQHGNVGVQSCVLNNVLALPWILVNVIYISWSEVFDKSIVYMELETTLASVYRVHLVQNRDVMLNLRTLFVQPSQVSRVCSNSNFVTCTIRFQGPSSLFISDKSRTGILSVSVEIHLVSSESFVGARAALARSASFQALLVGLFNVDSDYFMLVVVTYLGVHMMISHGSPVVEQVSLVKFVMFCLDVLLVFIKLLSFPPVIILLPLSIAPDEIT
ncbi:LOW QUALITY PROTEIN: hypothetical protein HID58_072579, partial [Brassica napus]